MYIFCIESDMSGIEAIHSDSSEHIVRGLASWSKNVFNPSGRKISLVPGKSITI